jgi:hypothetical protein
LTLRPCGASSLGARGSALVAAGILGFALASAARGEEAGGVAGPWVIAKAEMAPWADPLQQGGPEEERRLVGRTVTFAAHWIDGPSPLGCRRAVYRTHNDTADLLFEGGLAEPGPRGKPRNAVALARALGMTTRTVRTVETGCSEVAYHRLSPTTLLFGLNNRIYTLRPARSATKPKSS